MSKALANDPVVATGRRMTAWLCALAAPMLAAYRDDTLAALAPWTGRLALAACFASGGFAGLMERDGLPYTANLGALAVLAGLAILSGRLGLSAFAGFVLADLYGVTSEPSYQVTGFYLAGVLSSWFFLLHLLVLLPVAARQLAWFRGSLARLNGLISTLLITGFVEIWTRLAIVALRPLYTWRGYDAPLELATFADPANEWALGPLVLHVLAWIAAATGLLRWLIDLAVHYIQPERSAPSSSAVSASDVSVPRWARAIGKAGIVTATLAGVFASIPGAIAFWLAIAGAIAVRSFASASRLVARWDCWMLAIPAALRLIAGYLLCFYLADALIGMFRGAFEWRTMTTTGLVIIIVFAASLIFWPQVAPGQPAPVMPPALYRLFKGAAKVTPSVAFLAMMFLSTAVYAHHCSFEPGCECLTEDAALAALISGGATLAQLNVLLQGGVIVVDPAKLAAAQAYWVHAAMSNNAYGDPDRQIRIPPGWRKIDTSNFDGISGFYAETWVREEGGKVVDAVIAFRGTEFSWNPLRADIGDIWDNLFYFPRTTPQQEVAKIYARTISDMYPDARLVATGHSLGGALAKAAVAGTDKTAVVFNTSPRAWDGSNVVHIEESGDFLDILRKNRAGDIGFDFQDGSEEKAHSIYRLAEGMRRMAGEPAEE